jgi:hypothetical protein
MEPNEVSMPTHISFYNGDFTGIFQDNSMTAITIREKHQKFILATIAMHPRVKCVVDNEHSSITERWIIQGETTREVIAVMREQRLRVLPQVFCELFGWTYDLPDLQSRAENMLRQEMRKATW